ncbi:MAG: hypothetical protein QM756_15475 [Polyangiaceae bacterium]
MRTATLLIALVGSACAFVLDEAVAHAEQPLSAQNAADRAALALRWAPVHYQDVDTTGSHSLGGVADYITRYDFDGDLDARNNWENATRYAQSAYGYYSVVETRTHWFIVYMFFHARDWVDHFFDTEHENDSEGLLVTVQRDGSSYGVLRSMVTVAHTDFYSYVPLGSTWRAGAETIDGTLSLQEYAGELHPVTAQEAKGHGLKARPGYDIDGDGVVYYPSLSKSEVPSSPNDRQVSYALIDIFTPGGLWDNRNNASLFARYGSFAGDKGGGCGVGAFSCPRNSANAPWGWDDSNDGPVRGAMATDPAGLVKNYFAISESFSTAYTFNPYR